MKKLLFFTSIFILSLNLAFAQVAIQVTETAQRDSSLQPVSLLEKSLLWEITGNGLEDTSFLYGTIHLISKEDFLLTDETKSSFKKSERVVFEINMEEMNDFSVIFSLMGKMLMPNATTLRDLLDEEKYNFVKAKLADSGMPPILMGILERVKPLFLTTFASGEIDSGGFQNGDIVSYEMEFMQMAQQSEKEMGGLETIEYQLSVFDSIPLEAQAGMLYESLKAESDGSDQFKEMVKMYLDQDIEGMQVMFEDESAGMGEYEDILLINRNRNWIPLMREMMKEKPTFFAVGAGHLGGEYGVIRLLRQAGYTLRPLHVEVSEP